MKNESKETPKVELHPVTKFGSIYDAATQEYYRRTRGIEIAPPPSDKNKDGDA